MKVFDLENELNELKEKQALMRVEIDERTKTAEAF
jgi:hypothetical protein